MTNAMWHGPLVPTKNTIQICHFFTVYTVYQDGGVHLHLVGDVDEDDEGQRQREHDLWKCSAMIVVLEVLFVAHP